MQPFPLPLSNKIRLKISQYSYKLKKLFKKRGDAAEEEAVEESVKEYDPNTTKFLEENCRIIEIEPECNLLICDQNPHVFLSNRYAANICINKNLDFIFSRNAETKTGSLMVLRDKGYDLRKIKSKALILATDVLAIMHCDSMGNTEVAEMIRQSFPPQNGGFSSEQSL